MSTKPKTYKEDLIKQVCKCEFYSAKPQLRDLARYAELLLLEKDVEISTLQKELQSKAPAKNTSKK